MNKFKVEEKVIVYAADGTPFEGVVLKVPKKPSQDTYIVSVTHNRELQFKEAEIEKILKGENV